MRAGKKSLPVYYAASFLQGLCVIAYPAAGLIYKSRGALTLSDAQYGTAFLSQILTGILFAGLVPALLRKFRREQVYGAGILSNLIFLFLLAASYRVPRSAAGTFAVIFAANAFLGAGFSLLVSVLNERCEALFPEKRDVVLASLHGLLGLGAAASPLLIRCFHAQGEWTGALYVIACAWSLLYGVSLFMKIPHDDSGRRVNVSSRSSGRQGDRLSRGALRFLAVIALYGVVESIIGNWTAPFLFEQKKLNYADAATALSCFWIFLTAGRLLGTALAVKLDAVHLYRGAPVLMLAGLCLLFPAQSPVQLWMNYALIGLGSACFFPFSISLSIRYFEHHKEILSSLSLAALMLGVGIGTASVGYLREWTGMPVGGAFGIAAVCASVLIFAAAGLTPSEAPPQREGAQ